MDNLDEPSGNFDPVKRAIELGTRFVIVTMARSKEKSGLKEYVNQLKNLYSKHIPVRKNLLYFTIYINMNF